MSANVGVIPLQLVIGSFRRRLVIEPGARQHFVVMGGRLDLDEQPPDERETLLDISVSRSHAAASRQLASIEQTVHNGC